MSPWGHPCHRRCYCENLRGGSTGISLLSFFCWISQSTCCCISLLYSCGRTAPVCHCFPPEHTEGLELLWGVWQAGNEGLVSGGLRRAAVAYVGRLYLQEGLHWSSTGSAGTVMQGCCRQKPLPQGVETVEEWEKNSAEVASGKNLRVRNRLLPLKLYGLGQNHSSAGQKLAPSSLTCLCPCLCPGLLGTPSLPAALTQREGPALPPGSA